MKAITGVILLGLLAVAHANRQECAAEIKTCLNIYTDNLAKHVGNVHEICLDVNRFMECVLESDCDLSYSQKRELQNKMQRQLDMYGVQCDIDLSKAENRVRETTLSPKNTPDPSTCPGGIRTCMREYSNNLPNIHSKSDVCPLISRFMNCLFGSACQLERIRTEFTRITQNAMRMYGFDCDLDVDREYAKYRALNHGSRVHPIDRHHVRVSTLDRQGGLDSAKFPPVYSYYTGNEPEASKPRNAAMKTGSSLSFIISTVLATFFLAGFELLF